MLDVPGKLPAIPDSVAELLFVPMPWSAFNWHAARVPFGSTWKPYPIPVHCTPQVNGKLGGVNWGLYGGTK